MLLRVTSDTPSPRRSQRFQCLQLLPCLHRPPQHSRLHFSLSCACLWYPCLLAIISSTLRLNMMSRGLQVRSPFFLLSSRYVRSANCFGERSGRNRGPCDEYPSCSGSV